MNGLEEAIDYLEWVRPKKPYTQDKKNVQTAIDMGIEALKEKRPHDGWVKCSDRLPTADDGERVLVHLSFDKPTCEYVYIPWKTVEFEYKVGHIDAWFPIPKYNDTNS